MGLALALSAIVLAGVYRASLWRNPHRLCHWCGGRGKRSGVLFTYSRGHCGGCSGSGWRQRVGTRVLNRRR